MKTKEREQAEALARRFIEGTRQLDDLVEELLHEREEARAKQVDAHVKISVRQFIKAIELVTDEHCECCSRKAL